MTRPELAAHVVQAIGAEVATVTDLGTGWPTAVEILTGQGVQRVSLHVSTVSSHARRDYEWRFQNPGARVPVSDRAGMPILVGVDDVDGTEVLIVVDGASRVGRVARFSILFNKRISREAARNGWSQQTTNTGEVIYALLPRLFPLLPEVLSADVCVPTASVVGAAKASGLLEDNTEAAAARVRRTVSIYVRDSKFGRDVRAAYEDRCAMCRVGLDLIAGAHILPVSAPNSPDEVWNGVGLCHNHHTAFDGFNIWIDSDYTIRIRPDFVASAAGQPESGAFIQQTRPRLWIPLRADRQPRRDMLVQRYQYFEQDYEWAPQLAA